MDINLVAPITMTGYGVASANILHSLIKLGHQVALFPINDRNKLQAHPKLHESIGTGLKNAEMPNFDADCIRIWHQFDMSQFVGKGRHIAFPFFELDQFTEQEKFHTFKQDRIFVSSRWGKDILTNIHEKWEHGNYIDLVDIDVVPLGVDTEIFYPEKSYRKTTIFFNAGKWEVRKGHDILVEAFNAAFNEKDDVELWMLCHNPFYTEEENKGWEAKYTNSRLGKKIRILPPQESQSQVADIMRMTDCGVFPIRAEGWNLELLEMMACGKMNIATNYSGQTEFANDSNCIMFTPDGLEPAFDGKWFHKQGNWAKFDQQDVDDIIMHMQAVHGEKQRDGSKIFGQGVETGRKFTWDNTAQTIVNFLENS